MSDEICISCHPTQLPPNLIFHTGHCLDRSPIREGKVEKEEDNCVWGKEWRRDKESEREKEKSTDRQKKKRVTLALLIDR